MERQPAVIFDRDGTLASVGFSRLFLEGDRPDWYSFNSCMPFDPPVPLITALLNSIRPGVTRIMTSGRSEGDWPGDRRRRYQMQDWLVKHGLPIDLLIMREGGDTRSDAIVKVELYHRYIEPLFDVLLVVDDRQQVVDAWRSLGLTVLQVVDPELPLTIGI